MQQEKELLDAVKSRNFKLIEELIKGGADVNHLFETGIDSIFWAVTEKDVEMVRFLLKYPIDLGRQYDKKKFSLLHASAESYDITKLLLDKGIEVDSKDFYGNTPLFTALYYAPLKGGTYDVVELLLQHGADPYLKNRVGEILVGKKKVPMGESLSPYMVAERDENKIELELFDKYKKHAK
jgi:FOG: Ankyrin repeat